MRPDDVIEVRRRWERMNYAPFLPSATVHATSDWLAYVQAMAEAVPADEDIAFPTEQDVLWAWPEGVAIVFDEPLDVQHTIISTSDVNSYVGARRVTPHYETQTAAGLMFSHSQPVHTQTPDGEPLDDVPAIPLMWIGSDPTDVISGQWLPGSAMHKAPNVEAVSHSSRLALAIVTALGHRLTRLDLPVTAGRGERRRVQRELPSLRVLALGTGATVERGEGTGTVEWSKRWFVRGHWRLQPYGPNRSLRRPTWIDPYVKGPEDKPLDARPSVWRTA